MSPEYHPLVVHWKRKEYDVFIGRHNGKGMGYHSTGDRGWLGNPHYVGETAGVCPECNAKHDVDEAIDLFEQDFDERLNNDPEFREAINALEGKTLGGWCVPDHHCHGEMIAAYANDQQIGWTPQTGLDEW